MVVLGDLSAQMSAVLDQGGELATDRIGWHERFGLESLGELGNERRVDAIGLGEPVLGLGKIAHLAGIEEDDRLPEGVRQSEQASLVATAGSQTRVTSFGRDLSQERMGFSELASCPATPR